MASFAGNKGTGVESILLDGYNDGGDYGDIVCVTGSGGRSTAGVPDKNHSWDRYLSTNNVF